MVYAVGTYQRSQVWADELSLWRDTVEKSPSKYRPWTWLGKVQNERGDYTAAIRSWEKAATLVEQGSSEHAHLLNNLGLAHANQRDRSRAAAYYQQALEIVPDEGQFWANLAVAQLRLNDQQGWQSFEKAVQHARGRATVYLLRGQEYFQAGRYKEAAADFQHALDIQPEDETARRNLEAAEAMLRRTQSP
jgi:tetratricopeptide (TPR) repeat protein